MFRAAAACLLACLSRVFALSSSLVVVDKRVIVSSVLLLDRPFGTKRDPPGLSQAVAKHADDEHAGDTVDGYEIYNGTDVANGTATINSNLDGYVHGGANGHGGEQATPSRHQERGPFKPGSLFDKDVLDAYAARNRAETELHKRLAAAGDAAATASYRSSTGSVNGEGWSYAERNPAASRVTQLIDNDTIGTNGTAGTADKKRMDGAAAPWAPPPRARHDSLIFSPASSSAWRPPMTRLDTGFSSLASLQTAASPEASSVNPTNDGIGSPAALVTPVTPVSATRSWNASPSRDNGFAAPAVSRGPARARSPVTSGPSAVGTGTAFGGLRARWANPGIHTAANGLATTTTMSSRSGQPRETTDHSYMWNNTANYVPRSGQPTDTTDRDYIWNKTAYYVPLYNRTAQSQNPRLSSLVAGALDRITDPIPEGSATTDRPGRPRPRPRVDSFVDPDSESGGRGRVALGDDEDETEELEARLKSIFFWQGRD
ncbi:uncharacterized protein EI97DRAFT_441745 [Westerdykella ornata]|uniref:Uncharacterized protein n=1 Tax=Westerdykella ornata TaxID=318751 RepID=A0A6A6JLI3_WESOR|nr:uncharacterized protein EI97DRAFT_441745 [Westerdykella ornata]KAF2276973.1 hypothetical protein EI97DRAFT_441745 [Westerdykella ornata]